MSAPISEETGCIALRNWLDIRAVQIYGDRFHDLLHSDHQSRAVLLLYKNALPSGKWAVLYSHPLPDSEKGMGLDFAGIRAAGAQPCDFRFL